MSLVPNTFNAFLIESDKKPGKLTTFSLEQFTTGDLTIKVHYSSVNYKDALAGTASGKILRKPGLIGGIDLAGEVIESETNQFQSGDQIIMTGCGLSETEHGAYTQYAKINSKYAIKLSKNLTLKEAMGVGTAGFTSSLSLYRMQKNGQTPEQGPIIISGATGGVGMIAIDLLTQAGYEAHVITGKPNTFGFLQELGAKQCITRNDFYIGPKPLEHASWAGAIDTVGGQILAELLKAIQPYGNVACCGLANNDKLHTTVMPFIIRGISLLGISATHCPMNIRQEIWQKLANEWKPKHLDKIVTKEIALEQLPETFDTMLAGNSFGRTIVNIIDS